jgi:predicted RNase H-like HicB family nuclease
MNQSHSLTGIIEREGDGYVALCPELDIASQGDTVEGARHNLVEALELFFECADPSEVDDRLRNEEIRLGTLLSIIRQSGLPRTLFESE